MSKKEVEKYLTDVHKSGQINVSEAAPYVKQKFKKISEEDARQAVQDWQKKHLITEG
jgi:hypothetical protein